MKKDTFIAAVISYSKPIGYVILPFSCSRENDSFVSIYERISILNIGNYDGLTEPERAFFNLTESFSNQAVIKQFSKKNQNTKEFFNNLDKNILDEMIRPFIERKLVKIIEILLANNIPFYNGNDNSNLYPEDLIVIEKATAEASLKFVRTGEGTRYRLRAFRSSEEILLNKPENIILTNEPCWYLSGNKLIRFDENINGKLLIPFRNKDFVEIPKRMEHKYFSTFIRKIANRCNIEAEGFQMNDLQIQPLAILSLEVDWQDRIVVVLNFQYGDKVLLVNNPQKTFTTLLADDNGFIFNRFRRNQSWETAQAAFLKSCGLKQIEATYMLDESEPARQKGFQLIEWLSANRADLTLHGFIINQPDHIKYLLEVPVLNFTMQSAEDWFDIFGTVVLKEFEIPFVKFKRHIINNIKEYELTTGEIVILPDEWFSRFQEILIYAEQHSLALRIGKYQFKLLTNIPISAVRQLDDSLSSPKAVTLPDLANVTLRPYQMLGFYWMHSLRQHRLGGILADDMGLGKTLQAITLLASIYPPRTSGISSGKRSAAGDPVSSIIQLDLFAPVEEIPVILSDTIAQYRPPASLVVMPTSLIHNWLSEIARFAPWLRVYVHTGSDRLANTSYFNQYDVILTTYGILRNDIDMLVPYTFCNVILDESQAIKNPSAKTAQAVFGLQGQHRLVLTGTPIQNSLSDIWSQFNFLNPGMLGNHHHFVKYYLLPVNKNPDHQIAQKLKNLIKPFILRRTKEDVAPELPPLTETTVFCSMTEEQQKIYETEKSKVRNLILEDFKVNGVKNSSVLVLRSLMLLRQLANHPRMVDAASVAGSGKFEEVTESLETVIAENHKVLVFSSFVRHLRLIEEFCKGKGIKYAMLTGSTTDREKVITSFKSRNDIQLFLISLKAGGVGLNLTEAGYVFILDPWWNPAAEMQALNRAHRIGQDKKVFVYRFITKESVEEKIIRLQQKKKEMAELFVTPDSTIAGMSREEILSMFE